MPRDMTAAAGCGWLAGWGWDLLLGSIAAFYAVMAPYTKVEESFNVQVLFRETDGLPIAFVVRILLGCISLMSLRFLRIQQVRKKFGNQAETFFVLLTAIQFHLLFYSSRPLPNIFALALVNLAYSFWFKGSYLCTLQALIVAAVIFRCDMILLLGTIGLVLLVSRSVSLLEAVKFSVSTALICIALPRSMLVAYPLCMVRRRFKVGAFLDRRIVPYTLPVFLFVVLYSKLPHKELRFIIGSIPMFNVSASLAASRIYNNRKKAGWNLLYILMLGAFLVSLGYSAVTFMASYNNYPGGYALKALHAADSSVKEKMVHIDAFTAMSGVSRFCENGYPWRYSKEEKITIEEFQKRNFTYLLNEHRSISGYKCLFAVDGFSRAKLQPRLTISFFGCTFATGERTQGVCTWECTRPRCSFTELARLSLRTQCHL
ncbi:hypothetical protein PR202_gb14796 [Eleusine coracana subsp. coracana]|uniref:Mannosyltransferase n=1 Tax=Eleusine coracana subsp. coracana TaxID=191504 RepID=A0AAV5EXS2_ELECO|nr:hypothetical protein PR202_gb14796 [Eleusine coracana subsp. coracana]